MNYTDLRVLKTHSLLFKNLIILLNEKKLENITISEICKLSAINRATFYNHFDDLESLFETYLARVLANLKDSFNKAYIDFNINRTDEPVPITPLFVHVEENKDFYEVLFSPNTPRRMMNKFEIAIQEIPKYLVIKKLPNYIDLSTYFSALSGAIVGMIHQWINDNYRLTAEEMNKQLMYFFMLISLPTTNSI